MPQITIGEHILAIGDCRWLGVQLGQHVGDKTAVPAIPIQGANDDRQAQIGLVESGAS